LVLDSPRGRWRQERVFNERLPHGALRFKRVTTLRVITFTTDGRGESLPQPRSMLVAGVESYEMGALFARNDSTGEWRDMDLGLKSLRSVALYKDPVTGVDRVFAGGGGHEDSHEGPSGAVFSGVYDRSGEIRWDKRPEISGFKNRVMAFVECNSRLYFAAGTELYERIGNGRSAEWDRVYSSRRALATPRNSGLRGLTSIPNPAGSGEVILAALEGVPGLILRIDPGKGHGAQIELSIADFLSKQWGAIRNRYVIAAYNDMPSVENPEDHQLVNVMGLQTHCPVPGKEHSAWYLVRDREASYSLHEIRPLPLLPEPGRSSPRYLSRIEDGTHAATAGTPNLVGMRAIVVSPFPDDAGQALYLGGYDADFRPAHDTAWLYRVGLGTALSESQ